MYRNENTKSQLLLCRSTSYFLHWTDKTMQCYLNVYTLVPLTICVAVKADHVHLSGRPDAIHCSYSYCPNFSFGCYFLAYVLVFDLSFVFALKLSHDFFIMSS